MADKRRPSLLEGREIGRVVGAEAGSSLVIVAGVHGNEPAGLEAARRVLARLEERGLTLRGELCVLAGNVAALRQGERYQVKDLNRQWSEARVDQLRGRAEGEELDAEDREQLELLQAIEEVLGRARGRVHVADLHTSSAPGIPFVLFGDTLPQRHFVRVFPIPIIIGLEEQVDGVLGAYWTRRGCITFSVEGGQHEDPGSADALEAVIWMALEQAEMLPAGGLPEVARAAALLDHRRDGLPRILEVVSRRAINPEDEFTMEPGFRNLGLARSGQLLARDRRGEIRAPGDGIVILPLYQKLGNDGFFWGRAVSETRLRTSEVLRHLHLDRFLELLPGVRRDDDNPSRFFVDTHVARIYPLDVFHFLGYRRVRHQGAALTVERQPD